MPTMLAPKLLLLSILFAAIAAWSATQTALTSFGSLLFGCLAVATSCMSVLFLWILTLRPSPKQGVISAMCQLYFAGKSFFSGKYVLHQLRISWKNPRRAQDHFLMTVLKENRNTDYGRKYKLKDVVSREDFRKRHPLTTYEDYKPYVERVMDGELGVMTQVEPNALIQTSGTTGPSKYFPQKDHKYILTKWLDVLFANLHEVCPRLGLLQKRMFHYVQPLMSRAKSGASIRSGISLYENGFMASCFTTPPSGFRIKSFKEANYIHLLFALLDPNLGVFTAVFIGAIDSMMKQLEQRWEDIVYDIEHGTINEKVQFIDAEIRSTLEQAIGGGHPERAGELRRQFKQGFDGIMKRVWPKLEVMVAVDNTGIWPSLKAKFAKGIPLVSFGFGCSEGMNLGMSPWCYDDNRSMVFWVNKAFFEFIKLEDSNESQPQTFFIDELEVGKEYELVFTQESGLYRYRVGDVIRITGYHYNCPTFEFKYRLGLMLNLRYEKMNQVVLKAGLQSGIGQYSGVRLVEYAVAESTLIPKSCSAFEKNEDMPYYVIFLELDKDSENTGRTGEHGEIEETKKAAELTSNEIMISIDTELCDRNSDYNRLRREDAISHPRVHIMKPSTFEDLKQYVLNTTNTTANQYKVQRRIRTVNALNFMYHLPPSSLYRVVLGYQVELSSVSFT